MDIVDDDEVVIGDTERAHLFAELLRTGQHVRIGDILIAHIFDIEQHGAWNMALRKFRFHISAGSGQVVAGVEHFDIRIIEMAGEPLGFDQGIRIDVGHLKPPGSFSFRLPTG